MINTEVTSVLSPCDSLTQRCMKNLGSATKLWSLEVAAFILRDETQTEPVNAP